MLGGGISLFLTGFVLAGEWVKRMGSDEDQMGMGWDHCCAVSLLLILIRSFIP